MKLSILAVTAALLMSTAAQAQDPTSKPTQEWISRFDDHVVTPLRGFSDMITLGKELHRCVQWMNRNHPPACMIFAFNTLGQNLERQWNGLNNAVNGYAARDFRRMQAGQEMFTKAAFDLAISSPISPPRLKDVAPLADVSTCGP